MLSGQYFTPIASYILLMQQREFILRERAATFFHFETRRGSWNVPIMAFGSFLVLTEGPNWVRDNEIRYEELIPLVQHYDFIRITPSDKLKGLVITDYDSLPRKAA